MKQNRKKRKYILWLFLAAVCLLAGGAAVLFGKDKGVQITTTKLARMHVTDTYTEEGELSVGGSYEVVAEVSGAVKEILASENETVQAGDVLFLIDDAQEQYQKTIAEETLKGLNAQRALTRINQGMTASPAEYLDTVKKQLETTRADYLSAKSLHDANTALYKSGDIAKTEQEQSAARYESALSAYETAKRRYEESERYLERLKAEGISETEINQQFYDSEDEQLLAQISAQETTLKQIEDRIASCTVRAERAGTVTALPVKERSYVQAGTTAAVISGGEDLFAQADVLSSIAPYIKPGSAVEVVLPLRGKDETYQAKVSKVYSYAKQGTSALGLSEYRVHVQAALLDGAALSGREGYGVQLRFRLFDEENCLALPSGAVFTEGETNYVYVIKDGHAVKTKVETRYSNGSQTVIADGISEGSEVAAQADAEGLFDGVKVQAAES